MSEAEALEFIMLACSNAISSFSIYVTFTTGYLTIAFLVGNKLTGFQSLVTSGLYFIAAATSMFSTLAQISAFEKGISEYQTLLNSLPIWTAFSWIPVMTLVMTFGVLVSFYFMFAIRKETANAKST